MSILGVLLLATSVALPPFVVTYKNEWHAFSRDGAYLRKLQNFGGLKPNAVAIGPDGKSLAFTTGSGLYFAANDDSTPRRLGPTTGYFSDPAFDISGETIYFVHNAGPDAGPVGFHGSGVNAQLWKVSVADSSMQQLTSSHGCKRQPEPRANGQVYLIHSTCDGKSAIEQLGDNTRVLLAATYDNLEVHASPDDKNLAWFRLVFNGAELLVAPRETASQSRVLAKMSGTYHRLDLAWSSNGKKLFYQSYGHLLSADIKTKKISRVYDFKLGRAE